MGCTVSRPTAAVAPSDPDQLAPASLSPPRMRRRSGLAFRYSSESVREEETEEAPPPKGREQGGGEREEAPAAAPPPPTEGPLAYRLGRTLGSGGFSVVREATRLRDGARFAAKVIPMPPDDESFPSPLPAASPSPDKKKGKGKGGDEGEHKTLPPPSSRAEVEREVACLRALPPHPNVVQLVDAFADPAQRAFVVVTELLPGGELLDALLSQDGGAYPEATAASAAAQVCAALAHAHRHGVVHRDVKLDNVLLGAAGDLGSLKLADFGLSAALAPAVGAAPAGGGGGGETAEGRQQQRQPLFGLATVCGTPAYVAPEVLAAGRGGPRYGAEADCWSLGVLVFTLLGGYQPFWAESEAELFGLIRRGEYDDFEDEVWSAVSAEAKDLVASLLVVDPAARLSAARALEHPWLAAAVAAGALAPGALPPPPAKEEAKEGAEERGQREPVVSAFAAAAVTAPSRSLSSALPSLQPRASSSGDSTSNALALRRAASLAQQARNARRGGKTGGGPAAATGTQGLQARQPSSPLPPPHPPHPRRRPSVPLPQPPVSAFAKAAGGQQKQQRDEKEEQQVKVGASSADAERVS